MKVLVVDDDVVSRMVLMHLIDRCGEFEIMEAEDGEDAWRQLAEGTPPSICFCDLRMPRLSGMDLLQRVVAHGALGSMSFILVSAANDQDTVDQAMRFGAAGYIVKPFQVEQVRNHLGCGSGAQPAEAPRATVARLGIDCDRLLAYLGGLQVQLASASADIEGLLTRGEERAAQICIERLHAGCATLGLSCAALALKALSTQPLHSAKVQAVLSDAIRVVAHQSELVERLG